MIVNVHAAKINLSRLIERHAGEEVVIARNSEPVVNWCPGQHESEAHVRLDRTKRSSTDTESRGYGTAAAVEIAGWSRR